MIFIFINLIRIYKIKESHDMQDIVDNLGSALVHALGQIRGIKLNVHFYKSGSIVRDSRS